MFVLIDGGVNDNSLPAAVDTYESSKSASLSLAEGSVVPKPPISTPCVPAIFLTCKIVSIAFRQHSSSNETTLELEATFVRQSCLANQGCG